jgi:hypothetical protein
LNSAEYRPNAGASGSGLCGIGGVGTIGPFFEAGALDPEPEAVFLRRKSIPIDCRPDGDIGTLTFASALPCANGSLRSRTGSSAWWSGAPPPPNAFFEVLAEAGGPCRAILISAEDKSSRLQWPFGVSGE